MAYVISKNLFKKVTRGVANWSKEHHVIVLVRDLLRSNKDSMSYLYSNWFDVLGKEEEICANGLKKFTLETCPKTVNLREELTKMNITLPPKFTLSYPIRLRRTDEMEKVLCDKEKEQEKKSDLKPGSLTNKRHRREKNYERFYFKKRSENRKLWEKYNKVCYDIIHKDIARQREAGVPFEKVCFEYKGKSKNGHLINYKVDM